MAPEFGRTTQEGHNERNRGGHESSRNPAPQTNGRAKPQSAIGGRNREQDDDDRGKNASSEIAVPAEAEHDATKHGVDGSSSPDRTYEKQERQDERCRVHDVVK